MKRTFSGWGRWLADLVAVTLAVIAVVYAVQAKSGEVSRAHDATLPCAQAKHKNANVLCIIGAELDRRAAARDEKEAAALAEATAKTAKAQAKFRDDVCGLLHDLPSTKHTDAVRRDLHCLTSTPALVPGPTATAQTSPTAAPQSTPTATGHPSSPGPTTTRPSPTGRPLPSASHSPTPSASPSSCSALGRLLWQC